MSVFRIDDSQIEYEGFKESKLPPAEKILKVIFAIFLFVTVLGSGWVSRISLHILVWHIQPPNNSTNTLNKLGGLLVEDCNSHITAGQSNLNMFVANDWACLNTTFTDLQCQINTPMLKCFDSRSYIDETWIWATFLVVIAPYILTFFSTLFRVIFKSNRQLKLAVFVPVSRILLKDKKNTFEILFFLLL